MPGLQGNTAVRFSEASGVGGVGAVGDAGDFGYMDQLLVGSCFVGTLGSGGKQPFAPLGSPTGGGSRRNVLRGGLSDAFAMWNAVQR